WIESCRGMVEWAPCSTWSRTMCITRAMRPPTVGWCCPASARGRARSRRRPRRSSSCWKARSCTASTGAASACGRASSYSSTRVRLARRRCGAAFRRWACACTCRAPRRRGSPPTCCSGAPCSCRGARARSAGCWRTQRGASRTIRRSAPPPPDRWSARRGRP
ncbi:MAG: hypothetical protein AVDCRST_MAG39-611, partial [uncultured Sphingomonadaceae bacterium]